ncbi:hypothetical protein I3760_01G068100 [Carya illinoinensis]|nr:hypothetical protein I3760_01G068100 [Carya illinoinensis]
MRKVNVWERFGVLADWKTGSLLFKASRSSSTFKTLRCLVETFGGVLRSRIYRTKINVGGGC